MAVSLDGFFTTIRPEISRNERNTVSLVGDNITGGSSPPWLPSSPFCEAACAVVDRLISAVPGIARRVCRGKHHSFPPPSAPASPSWLIFCDLTPRRISSTPSRTTLSIPAYQTLSSSEIPANTLFLAASVFGSGGEWYGVVRGGQERIDFVFLVLFFLFLAVFGELGDDSS